MDLKLVSSRSMEKYETPSGTWQVELRQHWVSYRRVQLHTKVHILLATVKMQNVSHICHDPEHFQWFLRSWRAHLIWCEGRLNRRKQRCSSPATF
uniref:Uncharacterized protein n=1 Tax=Poecilia latipinna TaxID=48699 RepID=A0A3B3U2G9_9TELE